MEYVEILRARRVLTWYALCLLGLLALIVVSVYAAKGQAEFHSGHGTVPISDVLLGCSFGAWIVATCVAIGLNAEGLTIPIAWTRPTSRDGVAWRFVAVDLATIVIGYAFLFVLCLVFFALFGAFNLLVLDWETPVTAAIALGSAAMWYGLIALASARTAGHGVRFAGLSWAVFLIMGTIWAAPLPPLLHAIIAALNYLNPVAWVGGISSSSHGHTQHVINLPLYARALATWGIAAVAVALSVRLWSTREI
jgi:hypothetical protein